MHTIRLAREHGNKSNRTRKINFKKILSHRLVRPAREHAHDPAREHGNEFIARKIIFKIQSTGREPAREPARETGVFAKFIFI